MNGRIAALAVLLATLAPPAAWAAPLPLIVDKTDYQLTYPEGWAVHRFLPERDSASIVTKAYGPDEEYEAMSWTQGQTGVTEAAAPAYISSFTQVYRQGRVRTDSTVKPLGGKDFHSTDWRDSSEEGGGQRLRIYAYRQGSFLFISWIVYDYPDADGALAEVEAALATLQIKGTRLNAVHRNPPGHVRNRVDRVDLLGRSFRNGLSRPMGRDFAVPPR